MLCQKKYLPSAGKWADATNSFCITAGTINHRTWEKRYTETVSGYPSILEYANIVAAGIPCNAPVAIKVIEDCMSQPNDENQQKMKAVLSVMKMQNDPRLKRISMVCAKQLQNLELKQQAYKALADIKNDSEIEQFFIDFLVACEDKYNPILPIVNSYWE